MKLKLLENGYREFSKGHFPLGGIFRAERHFGGEWVSKDKRKYHSAQNNPSGGKQTLNKALLIFGISAAKTGLYRK